MCHFHFLLFMILPIQMEPLTIESSFVLKVKYNEVGIPTLFSFANNQDCNNIRKSALKMMALFGSNYNCKRFFLI